VNGIAIRAEIAADPSLLALAQVDLTGRAIGDVVTGSGDTQGAEALFAALGFQLTPRD